MFPQKNLESQMEQHLLLSVGEDRQRSLVLITARKSWDRLIDAFIWQTIVSICAVAKPLLGCGEAAVNKITLSPHSQHSHARGRDRGKPDCHSICLSEDRLFFPLRISG